MVVCEELEESEELEEFNNNIEKLEELIDKLSFTTKELCRVLKIKRPEGEIYKAPPNDGCVLQNLVYLRR